MSFTDQTWQRAAGILDAIYTHPFVEGLGDGSLPEATFKEYLTQDSLYLLDYGRALAGLAAQATEPDDMVFWAACAREVVVVERELHAAHVDLLADATASPTCRGYTSYLLSLLTRGDYRVAVAGILPCFWIYADVGRRLLDAAGDLGGHPYGDWIGTYADEGFVYQANRARAITDRLATTADDATLEAMHTAFATASRYEWMFWDAAWRLETWPV